MSGELTIEIPPQPEKKASHLWRYVIITVFIVLIAIAAFLSWWLANGRVSSAVATVDTIVYTVEANYTSQLKNIYIAPGDRVVNGQLLGDLDLSASIGNIAANARDKNRKSSQANNSMELGTPNEQLEKEMKAKLESMRQQEERLRTVWEERANEHVRAQLAMRDMENRNRQAYEYAQRQELEARNSMEMAKQEFEKLSLIRAELTREYEKLHEKNQYFQKKYAISPEAYAAEERMQAYYSSPQALFSPVKGRILRINARVGEKVQKGKPIIFIMPSDEDRKGDIWIQAWFSASDKGKLEINQKVSVKVEDSSAHLTGKIRAIGEPRDLPKFLDKGESGQNGRVNKYLPVRVDLDPSSEVTFLKPGTRVECQIQTRYVPGMGLFD